LDYAEMAKEQLLCGDIKQLLDSSSLSVLKVHIYRHDLFCDVSAAVARPLVLRQWRERVFQMLHGLAHPGVRATKRLVMARFVWRGCASDVAEWFRRCVGCTRGKLGGKMEAAAVAHSHSCREIFTCTCGYCGPSTGLRRRPHTHADHHRQDRQMARSGPNK
jgi:hypothetical protein